jgi:sugar lactone lactonase YvrE
LHKPAWSFPTPKTEGRAYQISSEHHVRTEIKVQNAAHWKFYALQTEEERGESGFCLPIEINSSRDICFANFHSYRVISSYQPFPYAVKISNSSDIRFRNFHCDSNSKASFDASIYDQTHDMEIRDHEFAWLDVSGNPSRQKSDSPSTVIEAGAKVEKLAGGFFNISGGTVDEQGNFYFVDSHWQRILRWDASKHQLSTISDFSLQPINLAVDKAGNLMVVSDAGDGMVYSLNPKGEVSPLKSNPVSDATGKSFFLPVSDWRNNQDSLAHPTAYFYSPDGTAVLPVADDFLSGAVSWGIKSSPQIRSFGLGKATPGKPFYVTDEYNLRTWRTDVTPNGSLTSFELFAECGGESVTSDSQGNVYIADGQIYVYDSHGKWIGTIETPERPLQLMFGGSDRKTLFIAARSSLYALRLKYPGQ